MELAPALPEFAQLEPVGRCNLACTMCAVTVRDDGDGPRAERLMPFELFRSAVDALPSLRNLHLQGLGEPLLHPRFFDMVEYAAGRGVAVSTNSNLTLLTPARAARAVSSGLSAISVSIDAADPALYASIRLGGSLHKVRRNLGRLMDARAREASARPEVRIVMVLMRRNLGELAAMVRLAHEHGVPEIFVQRLSHDLTEPELPQRYLPVRASVEAQALRAEDLAQAERAYAQARALAEALGVVLRLPRLLPRAPRADGGCDWPWRGAYLAWNGTAMPCCMVGTPDRAALGDVARDGLPAVWSGESYRRFRQALLEGKPPSVCASCSVYRGTF